MVRILNTVANVAKGPVAAPFYRLCLESRCIYKIRAAPKKYPILGQNDCDPFEDRPAARNVGSARWHYRNPSTAFELSYTTYVIETAGTTFSRLGVMPLNNPLTPSPLTVLTVTSHMPV